MMPELKVRSDSHIIVVGVTEVPRLVDLYSALWLSDVDPKDADLAYFVGELGTSMFVANDMEYWPLSKVLRQLPSERLAELGCLDPLG